MYRVRIHYYLADDKIEIISQYSRNDGRDRFPKFLRKTRIEKPAESLLPSENSQFSSSVLMPVANQLTIIGLILPLGHISMLSV